MSFSCLYILYILLPAVSGHLTDVFPIRHHLPYLFIYDGFTKCAQLLVSDKANRMNTDALAILVMAYIARTNRIEKA